MKYQFYISEIWKTNFIYYLCHWFSHLYSIEEIHRISLIGSFVLFKISARFIHLSMGNIWFTAYRYRYCLCLAWFIPLSTGLVRFSVHIMYGDIVSVSVLVQCEWGQWCRGTDRPFPCTRQWTSVLYDLWHFGNSTTDRL